jgi:hypothetical protein
MLDILKNKILSWTPEGADAFFRGITRYSLLGGRIWEIAPTGYYLWSSEYAGYFDNNGKVCELFIKDNVEELTFKQALSNYVDNSESIKVENPTLIQTGDIFGLGFTYTEQQRPYNCQGVNVANLMSVPANFEDNILQVFQQLLLSYEQLLKTIDSMQGNQTSNVYPMKVYDSYFVDPNTQSAFWAGPIEFVASREDSIKDIEDSMFYADTLVQKVYGYSNARSIQADLNNFIKTQCTILQLP